jgi:Fe-S-cluster-containing dehydrogenase component
MLTISYTKLFFYVPPSTSNFRQIFGWLVERIVGFKDDRLLVYLPEICIGCGTSRWACPKDALVNGSVGAVTRGLIDKTSSKRGRASASSAPSALACVHCDLCAEFSLNHARQLHIDSESSPSHPRSLHRISQPGSPWRPEVQESSNPLWEPKSYAQQPASFAAILSSQELLP